MNFPFTGEELASFLGLFGAGIAGYADLRAQVRAMFVRHTDAHEGINRRVGGLEEQVAEIMENQQAIPLLAQAVDQLRRTADAFSQESQETRKVLGEMGKSLVRIETKLENESRKQ